MVGLAARYGCEKRVGSEFRYRCFSGAHKHYNNVYTMSCTSTCTCILYFLDFFTIILFSSNNYYRYLSNARPSTMTGSCAPACSNSLKSISPELSVSICAKISRASARHRTSCRCADVHDVVSKQRLR
eukprot:SAG22_NODE_349_length_11854_cov_8.087282_7_plen_128_part_00